MNDPAGLPDFGPIQAPNLGGKENTNIGENSLGNNGDVYNSTNNGSGDSNDNTVRDSNGVPQPGDFNDPNVSPGDNWVWRGGKNGAWWNNTTKESLRPALDDPNHGPHWDYQKRNGGPGGRIYPGGSYEPK